MDDLEAIKQLKARYFRTMDTKDWAGMREVFADDVVLDTTDSGGGVIRGADEFMAFLRDTPEIELTSPTTATGVWAMQDVLFWPDGGRMYGYGHYHESYELIDGEWRITTSTLTRLHMGFTGPDTG